VVFYEPVASEIRTIQRRGRTGRKMAGKVVILMARGTRDEAYYWSSRNKERRMMEELETLRKQLSDKIAVGFPSGTIIGQDFRRAGEPAPEDTARPAEPTELVEEPASDPEEPPVPKPRPAARSSDDEVRRRAIEILEGGGQNEPAAAAPLADVAVKQRPGPSPKGQLRLGDFPGEKTEPLTIIVDHREFNSGVVRELSRNELRVVSRQLPVGDYILSDRVAVERKVVSDFVGSLLEGRLFGQIRDLKGAYVRPVLIIEGENLYGTGGVSRESIMGTLASIVTDYGVPTIFTKDDRETAGILVAMAKREHAEGRIPAIRGEKGSLSLPERQQFIIEGLPHISGTLSQRLLAQLGSIYNVFNAGVEDLSQVKGVGRKTAEELYRTIRSPYMAERHERDSPGKVKDDKEEE
jgi:Fanconi anemia group M protein